jgi:CubicO group peptidase (beta-lactamase class C family)
VVALRSVTGPPVHGDVDEGYGSVADAFRRNLAGRGELGAACAAYLGDRPVVDLWGGHADAARTRPWVRDTLVPVFSTTKGMAALALAVAHSRGLFALDEPVATYWPEFAANGKAGITVRQMLNHQAGLAAIDVPLDLAVLGDPDRLGAVLAAQAPRWEPGRRHGYHGQSLGWYQSQLIRRVDPDHRTIGRFFADEIAGPLDAEFTIGVPDDLPAERIATIVGGGLGEVAQLREMPPAFLVALINPWSITHRVFTNPRALARLTDVNRRELLRLELPSVSGTGSARALARIYGCFATGAGELGVDPATIAELEAPAAAPPGGTRDVVLHDESAYVFGMMKAVGAVQFGSSPRAYGHDGIGGSFAFADPDLGLGWAYTPNRAGFAWAVDPREKALRDALYAVPGRPGGG